MGQNLWSCTQENEEFVVLIDLVSDKQGKMFPRICENDPCYCNKYCSELSDQNTDCLDLTWTFYHLRISPIVVFGH